MALRISDKKKASKQIHKRAGRTEKFQPENLFEVAVEAAPNAMIMVNHEGKIALVNSRTEALFGWRREELLGKTIEILLPERFRRHHVCYRTDYSTKPSVRAMGAGRDLFAVRKDGSEVPVEIGLNPVNTAEGQFTLASVIDITQRRILERKLAHSEALASIGSMVAVVAHEIRNPLGSIVMGAKALARGNLSEEERNQVTAVLAGESQRLNSTLSELLQFARPRELKLEVADINTAVHETLLAAKADPAIVGKALVEEDLDKKMPSIPFDPAQIRQVLWNIIRNGLQALHGRGQLQVRTEARASEIAVHIQDSGAGIPPEHLEKIFTPFFTTKPKGTGLGLPISRSIVNAHGGDIQVDTAPGKGSRFSITLPIPPRRD